MESCYHDKLWWEPRPHHLIYREELKKDGDQKEVVCWYCKKPILGGSLHNCVECGNRPVHYNSSSSIHHCLDFTEKLENEVVCNGCDEPVLLGPAYKCSVSSECSFFIHKSCADLSQEMNHPWHPDHALSLRWFNVKLDCYCCSESHNRCFFYICGPCNFYLDIKCANRLLTNPNDCHHDQSLSPPHHLIYREELKKDGKKKLLCSWRLCRKPIWRGSLHNCLECGNRPVHFYSSSSTNHCLDLTEKLENEVVCNGCDEPVLDAAYKCPVSECSIFIHKSCADLSPEINHPLHPDHALSLRWFGIEWRCDACGRSHDRSFFYICVSCDYKLDIKCANRNPNNGHQHEFSPFLRRIQFNCDACGQEANNNANLCSICNILVHKKCAEIPSTIKIKLHSNFLNLIYSPHEVNKRDDMFCRNCGDKVNTKYAAYCCKKCRYVLHTECLRHLRDQYEESSATSDQSVCRATHLIKALNQAEDEGPHPGEIQHFSHQEHQLVLCDENIKNDDKLCQACTELITSIPFYSCAHCNFFLHTRCAKLPIRIEQHPLHDFHSLTLLLRAPNWSGMFFCDLCSCHHRGFTYKCDDCRRQLDVQCATLPESLKHEGHQHLFYLAQDSKNRKCKACPEDNKRYVFVCTSCDFILGIRCANLPLVARHKYDTHLLKLTYAAEEDCREYYCLICEEKRDPNHWFYYCEECDFPAHTNCVLVNYP